MSIYLKGPASFHQTGVARRFLGRTGAVLALVIAMAFGIALVQGNEAAPDVRGGSGIGESYMRSNPEDYPTELKQLLAMIEMAKGPSYPIDSHLAHEFAAERAIPNAATRNPMEGLAE